MINPLQYDDLNEAQQKQYRELMAIRSRNAERVGRIEQLGGVLDLSTARVEHMMSALVAFGVLTIDQVLALNKDWEIELKRQSKEILAKFEAQRAEQHRQAMAPKLIIPGR